jgi:hypothetical protein
MTQRSPTLTTSRVLVLLAFLAPASLAANHMLGGGGAPTTRAGEQPQPVVISGNGPAPLAPGTEQPLNLRLSNRSRHRQVVTRLMISLRVDAAHRRAGCNRTRSFHLVRMQRREYPIVLAPGRTRSLLALGVDRVPRVRMLNLPTNQDACKDAALQMRYSATVRRERETNGP